MGVSTNINRESEILHLFLPSGKTFTFRNVTIVTDNESSLVLKYTAMSDGKVKIIDIQKTAIVGWSRNE